MSAASVESPNPGRLSMTPLKPLTVARLHANGIDTVEQLAKLGYQDLIALRRLGIGMVLDIQSNGFQLSGMPKPLTAARIKKDKENLLRQSRDRKTNGAKAVAKARTTPKKPASKQAEAPAEGALVSRRDEGRPYVRILVQRAYACRNCEGVTLLDVDDPKEPSGIQSPGFTWSDGDFQSVVVEPFFICRTCCTDVEVVGRLTATLMDHSLQAGK